MSHQRAKPSANPMYAIGDGLPPGQERSLNDALRGQTFELVVNTIDGQGRAHLEGAQFNRTVIAGADLARGWKKGARVRVAVGIGRSSIGVLRFEAHAPPVVVTASAAPQNMPALTPETKAKPKPPDVKPKPPAPQARPVRQHVPERLMSHRIRDLAAARSFSLYIDESGGRFDPSNTEGSEGCMAGVLATSAVVAALRPEIHPEFHAKEIRFRAATEGVLNRLLAEPVGILGFALAGAPVAAGEAWISLAAELILWVLRMLPLLPEGDGAVELTVFIEQRGEWSDGTVLREVCSNLRTEFGRGSPHRAHRVCLKEIRIIKQERDPFLGYADAVAHTLGGIGDGARERLARSGLLNVALFKDATRLRRAGELLARNEALDPNAFRDVFASADLCTPGSLAAMVADDLAERVRGEPGRWRRYLDFVVEHLESKGVDVTLASRQVAWLEGCRPSAEQLPPVAELALLVAQLETANHRGEVGAALLDRLDAGAGALADVRPDLACQADLVRAVHHTNRFEFELASSALARWRETPARPLARQHAGRVASSMGQHCAFRGSYAEADRFFAEALSRFADLGDPVLSDGETAQTSTYRALAALDRNDITRDEMLVHVDRALGSRDARSIDGLARSGDRASRYRHHLLLRYLVQAGTPDERGWYLGAHPGWADGEGFPWPLIQAWRAAMLHDGGRADDAVARARKAIAGCEVAGAGPTLRFIGQVLRAGAARWEPELAAQSHVLFELRTAMPAIADRVARIERNDHAGASFADVIHDLLPFNFR